MSAMLTEAVRGLGLRPGESYRATVDGKTIEVRMLAEEEVTPDLTAQVMLQPWAEFPIRPAGTVFAQRGPLPLPDPPVIPAEDEESGV